MTHGQVSGALHLKKGRDKPLRQRHPWIFSGSIARIEGNPAAGDVVGIFSSHGEPLGLAFFNPTSQISGRVISWKISQTINPDFWKKRLQQAYQARTLLSLETETTAYRLVFSEADHLPGLIIDQYNGYLVIQLLSAGMDVRRSVLTSLLADLSLPNGRKPLGILERSESAVLAKEGLAGARGLLHGRRPPRPLFIEENGLKIEVDLVNGQKTGFYLDQRANRRLFLDPALVANRQILNAFAYTGGFGLAAARGGATSVINVETSEPALEIARQNMALNFQERQADEYIVGDVFQIMRTFRNDNRLFDAIVLDPPKFAHNARDIQQASRGYKDINWLALRLLRPGGVLATFSCSGHISADLFQKILFGAALDAGRSVQIIQPLFQAADHPILLTFPESAYLKGLLCRVW